MWLYHEIFVSCLIHSTWRLTSFHECFQVKKHPVLRKQQAIIPAVARVLAWSQSYMRQRKVHMQCLEQEAVWTNLPHLHTHSTVHTCSLCLSLSRMSVALWVSETWREQWLFLSTSLTRWIYLDQKWTVEWKTWKMSVSLSVCMFLCLTVQM